ncbi:hypothetical protein VTJ04DRAFT_4542 [Mycothermus thermophilus]|uniref:uncharacterized protein n=1 Tax=Humicola insolens TaxID=85995 RepID=UPI003742DE65
MASRRATTALLTRPVISTASVRLTSSGASRLAAAAVRQHHHLLLPTTHRSQQPLLSIRIQQPIHKTQTSRYYSTDSPTPAAQGESKIYSFDDVKKLASSKGKGSDVILVDVREPHELASTGKIPGAINIPITSAADSFHISDAEFEDRFGRPRPPRDAEVVFYCKAGVRCKAAAGLARDAGWTKVGEYPGSWTEWVEKGGEVER